MSKRVIKRIIIAVSLIAMMTFAYGIFESQKSFLEYAYHYIFVSDMYPIPNPNVLMDYPENRSGYYQFNPQTILASLDQGKTDAFTSLLVGDPNDVNVEYDRITWNQADFLHVANALSQQIWNEPLDLDGWDIYFLLASKDCNDSFDGFDDFKITYYKTIKIGWETVYTARHIELTPWKGVATWAGDGDFSTPFIFGWTNIKLMKFKTTAEQAVQIADENGGKIARLNNDNKCRVYVNIIKNNWDVYYNTPITLNVFINPFTGKVHSIR
jgi:hypothetical protein